MCLRDIVLSGQVEIHGDPDEVIAVATAPKKEEAIEAAPAAEEAPAEALEPAKQE